MADNLLYFCSVCLTVTVEPVAECPACGDTDEPLSLAFTYDAGDLR
jgi:rubrerythrin